jgi:hypothetical protein
MSDFNNDAPPPPKPEVKETPKDAKEKTPEPADAKQGRLYHEEGAQKSREHGPLGAGWERWRTNESVGKDANKSDMRPDHVYVNRTTYQILIVDDFTGNRTDTPTPAGYTDGRHLKKTEAYANAPDIQQLKAELTAKLEADRKEPPKGVDPKELPKRVEILTMDAPVDLRPHDPSAQAEATKKAEFFEQRADELKAKADKSEVVQEARAAEDKALKAEVKALDAEDKANVKAAEAKEAKEKAAEAEKAVEAKAAELKAAEKTAADAKAEVAKGKEAEKNAAAEKAVEAKAAELKAAEKTAAETKIAAEQKAAEAATAQQEAKAARAEADQKAAEAKKAREEANKDEDLQEAVIAELNARKARQQAASNKSD